MKFTQKRWILKNFTYMGRKPQQNKPLLLIFSETKCGWTASKNQQDFFFASLGFSLGPRGSRYGSRTHKAGVWEDTLNCLSPSSPHYIKRGHNYREHASVYCTRYLTYIWGKIKACTSQDCNAKETPPISLHFVAEWCTEVCALNCYLQVKSSFIQLYHYPYHDKLEALLFISVAQ